MTRNVSAEQHSPQSTAFHSKGRNLVSCRALQLVRSHGRAHSADIQAVATGGAHSDCPRPW